MDDPVRLRLVVDEPPWAEEPGKLEEAGQEERTAWVEEPAREREPARVEEPPGGEEIRPGEPSPLARAPAPRLALEAGQPVKGRVSVEVLKTVDFRELQVRFVWHTEGRGNRDRGEGGTVTLARLGRWEAGTEVTYPFELTAPGGPLSYEGQILSIAWDLEARLDRSLLHSDVTRSLPVTLGGAPEPERASLGPVPQKKEQLERVKRGAGGVWTTVGVLLLLTGIVIGALKGWELTRAGQWLVGLAMGGGLLLTLKGMWGRLARGKLGEPLVHLSTTTLRRGEEIRFSVVLRPEQRTELRDLRAILECEERVVHGHGQYQSHQKRVVYQQRATLAKDVTVEPYGSFRRKGTLTVPPDGPPSFGAPSSQIIWWLRFRADIVGWPDWKEPFLLTVWP